MHSKSASRDRKHHYSPSPPRKEYYSSKDLMRGLEVSLVGNQRTRHKKQELHGEIRKIKPPTFDGQNKR